MKPLHLGLLIVGAAVAGGLAVKMTQAPAGALSPAPAVTARQQPVAPATAPIPAELPAKNAPTVAAAPQNAPAPVYTEAPHRREPVKQPRQVAVNKPPVYPETPAPAVTNPAPPQPEPQTAPAPVETAKTIAPEPPPPPEPQRVTVQAGTLIPARLIQTLSTDRAMPGDSFNATLAEPLVVNGFVIAEKGARVDGRVLVADRAGRVQGVSRLELGLTSFVSSDGQRVAISTSPWLKQGETTRRADAAKVGGGAALGAIIGAIAGGGKGAAIGAGVGGGAGAGTVAMTRGKEAVVQSETVIRFRLQSPVTITERR